MSQYSTSAGHFSSVYEAYREPALTNRFFRHAEVLSLTEALQGNSLFTIREAGNSAEGRPLRSIACGSGTIPVFLWTQMHGDEPTATMAVFDILNYLNGARGAAERNAILQRCRLYFMPMVNPDGAERITRRNAQGIDINRDAAVLQTPEARALMQAFKEINPAFAFNLHDQSTRYACGDSRRQAALSFLAPAFNPEKSMSPNRLNAMKIISCMAEAMNGIIPGHMAKYDDEFEPRAFGDNFQRLGASTILIESGGKHGDPEKQFIRKLNFIAILTALSAIADSAASQLSTEAYEQLPFNKRSLFDLLLHNVTIPSGNRATTASIGINRNELPDSSARSFTASATVEDTGDLNGFYGLEELDCSGLTLAAGKIMAADAWNGMPLPASTLFIQGRPQTPPRGEAWYTLQAPLFTGENFGPGVAASFILSDKHGKPVYSISNGVLTDAEHGIGAPPVGIILK